MDTLSENSSAGNSASFANMDSKRGPILSTFPVNRLWHLADIRWDTSAHFEQRVHQRQSPTLQQPSRISSQAFSSQTCRHASLHISLSYKGGKDVDRPTIPQKDVFAQKGNSFIHPLFIHLNMSLLMQSSIYSGLNFLIRWTTSSEVHGLWSSIIPLKSLVLCLSSSVIGLSSWRLGRWVG